MKFIVQGLCVCVCILFSQMIVNTLSFHTSHYQLPSSTYLIFPGETVILSNDNGTFKLMSTIKMPPNENSTFCLFHTRVHAAASIWLKKDLLHQKTAVVQGSYLLLNYTGKKIPIIYACLAGPLSCYRKTKVQECFIGHPFQDPRWDAILHQCKTCTLGTLVRIFDLPSCMKVRIPFCINVWLALQCLIHHLSSKLIFYLLIMKIMISIILKNNPDRPLSLNAVVIWSSELLDGYCRTSNMTIPEHMVSFWGEYSPYTDDIILMILLLIWIDMSFSTLVITSALMSGQ